jgi:hypothetical protein
MRFIALTCLTIVWTASGLQSPSVSGRALYDPNPEHVWNRVHAALQVRTAASGEQFGFDTLDPLLWRETKHLLTGPSHTRALDLLDEFLHANGERLILDPVKRAVFQRDLWAVFDWAMSRHDDAQEARMALAQRLVRVVRRVALARKEIEALPDTYDLAAVSGGFGDWSHGAQPQGVLPRDLFDASASSH